MNSYFYTAVIGFGSGIVIQSFFPAPIFLILVCIPLFAVTFFISRKNTSITGIRFAAITLALLGASLGMFHYYLHEFLHRNTTLTEFVGKKAVFEGTVIAEPAEKESGIQLTVLIAKVNGKTLKRETKLLVTTDLYPKKKYGDSLKIEGTIEKPKNIVTDSGNPFDYISYLAENDIFYLSRRPHISTIATGKGNPVLATLFKTKQLFLAKISAVLAEPHASLMAGYLVSGRSALSQSLQDKFTEAGVVHTVALSGFNVTIIAQALATLFSPFPAIYGYILGSLGVILFVLMAGSGATIVRAGIMAILVVCAKALERDYDVVRSLTLAGLLMVLQNPMIVAFDTSFQLSFLSTIGLIFFSPPVAVYANKLPDKFKIRETVTATLATQIFVLPYILYKTGNLSIVALPVNLLILFTLPFTMLVGFLTGAAGFISIIIAWPFAFISYILLSYQLGVVNLFTALPFAALHLNGMPLWITLVWYVVYGMYLLSWYAKQNKNTSLVRHASAPAGAAASLGAGRASEEPLS